MRSCKVASHNPAHIADHDRKVTDPTPEKPAFLFIAASVLCSPGVDDDALHELGAAIDWARGNYSLWLYLLRDEHESPAFRRASDILQGEHLIVRGTTPKAQMTRILREVSRRTIVGDHPSVVWLLSDTTPSSLTRKDDRQLAGNVQAKLYDGADFRILGSRLGYAVRGDDLREIFAAHERVHWGDEPEF